MARKILVVEEDKNLGSLLQLYLIKDGYEVRIERAGKLGLEALVQYGPDAIIVDWTLPDLGIEICRQIRYQSDIPIMMISSRTDELDAVLALEMGYH